MCFSSYYKRENYNTKSIIECTCVCMKTLTCGRKYKSMQGVRKNVICYIRPVVGWYNLGININEKLKNFFSNFNEKLKGVVEKDKKLNILSIKIQVAKLIITQDSTFCLSIANQRQDRNIHSRTHTAQTLTFTHRVNIWCAVYSVLCIRTLSISNIKLAITCII